MKLHIDLPWGGTFDFEKQPMDSGRAEMIGWLVGIALVGSGLLRFFSMLIGA